MTTTMTTTNQGSMEGAPYWYGTRLDELDFEWTSREKVMIERFCEKIHQNIDEEEMTPKQRFEATMAGKPRDRVMMENLYYNVYAVRTLDSWADALKPVDVYRSPKLLVLAHLATVARFKLDYPAVQVLTYGEDLWGGKGRMIDYGNPVVAEVPIKSMKDLEGIEVPDPRKHGLYPGYLWANREMRRIFDQYELSDKMHLWPAICPAQQGNVMLNMLGMGQTMIALRKDPELVKQCMYLCTEWSIEFGKAMALECKPDALWFCSFGGMVPLRGNEWIIDEYAKAVQEISKYITVTGAMAYPSGGWFEAEIERGAQGPNAWVGNNFDHNFDYKWLIDLSREHNLYVSILFPDTALLNGPVSDIEEEIRVRCEYGKLYPKFAQGVGVVDYWTPQAHLDAAVAAVKKYGKY